MGTHDETRQDRLFRMFRFGRIGAAFLFVLSALIITGCDTRDTDVTGPEFVGFGYVPADLQGVWNGTLSVPDFSVFETLVLEVDEDAAVFDGLDSRSVSVTSGEFTFLNTDTGELSGRFRFADGVRIDMLGFLEPGGDAISGGFFSTVGLLGELRLVRTAGEGTFDISDFAGTQELLFLDLDIEELREGLLLVDETGEIAAGSLIDGEQVENGQFALTDSERGYFTASILVRTGEQIEFEGILSLEDGRAGGTLETINPDGEGLFLMEPEDLSEDE